MLSLIIASDVSKRTEEEGVFRVMNFTLCFTPSVRHACAFCGFVLVMFHSFDSSFFLMCALAVEEFVACVLGAYDWAEYFSSERCLQVWSCKRLQGEVHFFFFHYHGNLGRWRRIDILGLRFLEPWRFHIGRSSVHTHFHHLQTIYGLRSLLRISVSGGGSQLRTCTLQVGLLAWYLLLTIVLFRLHKAAMGMNMSFLPQ